VRIAWKVFWSAVLVFVVFLAFALGTLLLVITLLGIGITFLLFRFGRSKWSKVIWFAVLLALTGLAGWLGLWPKPDSTASCSTSPLPLYEHLSPPAAYVTSPSPNAVSQTQVEIYRKDFDKRRFELMQDAEYAEEGFTRLEDGHRMVASFKDSGIDLAPLDSAIEKLDAKLTKLPLDKIRQRRNDLAEYLSQASQRSQTLQEESIGEFRKRFDEGLKDVSLEDVHESIAALDNALANAREKIMSGELDKRLNASSYLSAELKDEGEASAVLLRESVLITVNNAVVERIDASSLQIGAEVMRSRFPAATQSFEVYFNGVRQSPPKSLASLLVPEQVRDVRIDNILSLPVSLVDTCMKSRLIKFSMLRLSWPEPYPVTLTTVVSLPGTVIQKYAYRFQCRRDSSVRDIALPPNSFFASSYKFDRERVGNFDMLTPADPNQKLNMDFFRSQSIWIELLPEPLRYSFIQPVKDFLFRDNAMSMLCFLLVGAVASAIVTPEGEGNDARRA
jgi:hypothetical protein